MYSMRGRLENGAGFKSRSGLIPYCHSTCGSSILHRSKYKYYMHRRRKQSDGSCHTSSEATRIEAGRHKQAALTFTGVQRLSYSVTESRGNKWAGLDTVCHGALPRRRHTLEFNATAWQENQNNEGSRGDHVTNTSSHVEQAVAQF